MRDHCVVSEVIAYYEREEKKTIRHNSSFVLIFDFFPQFTYCLFLIMFTFVYLPVQGKRDQSMSAAWKNSLRERSGRLKYFFPSIIKSFS